MDKELLRIVIISVGALVILGMILWGVLKGKSKSKNMFGGDQEPLENIDRSLFVNTADDDFDIVPLSNAYSDDDKGPRVKTRLNTAYIQETKEQGGIKNKTDKPMPVLLQLHLVAKNPVGFRGLQLVQAFERVGLIYGSVKVFERLDAQNRVDYAVASMTEQGIFPGDNWESYYCPGISFFMQPRELDDVQAVFDDLINTAGQLSALLQGDILDEKHQPLTEEILQQIEAKLS